MVFDRTSTDVPNAPLAEINMIPLIDVMLVLLVIFIVTAPLLTHAVKVDLPKASSSPNLTRAENIQLGIKADGTLYWNGEETTREQLAQRLEEVASLDPQPELHLRADARVEYGDVAQVMAQAARRGLTRIGFISEPQNSK